MEKIDNLCDNNLPKSSLVPLPTPAPTASPTPNDKPSTATTTNKNQSLKQRINSLVMKALAENQEKDKQQGSSTQQQLSPSLPPQSAVPVAPSSQPNLFHGDTWKIKVLQNTRVISTVKESMFVCEAIAKSGTDQQTVISVDCEGINLGIKGQLTIVEVSVGCPDNKFSSLIIC